MVVVCDICGKEMLRNDELYLIMFDYYYRYYCPDCIHGSDSRRIKYVKKKVNDLGM